MTRRQDLLLILLLITPAAYALQCAPEIPLPSGGIGGTGLAPATDAGGIGGTGLAPAPGGGGIGGTGLVPEPGEGGIGGTGVVGTITGFASLCVNGLEVHYAAKTPVDLNGEPGTLGMLKRGQVVTLQASGPGDHLATPRISVQYAVVGPVTGVENGRLRVMNQTVVLPAGQDQALSTLKPGDSVRVSGHRLADGSVQASEVSRAEPGTPASLTGRVTQDNGWRIGGTAIAAEMSPTLAGRELLIRGRWLDGKLVPDAVRNSGAAAVLQRSERVVMEAVVHGTGPDGQLRTDHQPVIREHQDIALQPGDRIIVSGRIDREGRVHAERLELMHERPDHELQQAARERDQGRHAGPASAGAVRVERQGSDDVRERSEKTEKSERPEKVEKADKPEKIEKPETVEKPEKAEKVERPEKVDKVEKTDRVERPDRVDRNERD